MKRWPKSKSPFWETAPFFRLLLPFAAGIWCYDRGWLQAWQGRFSLFTIAAAFLTYTAIVYAKKNTPLTSVVTFVFLNAILFFSGISVSSLGDIRNDRRWFGKTIGNGEAYLVRVTDIPAEKEHTWKVPVSVIYTIHKDKVSAVTGSAFLYIFRDSTSLSVHKGDSILVPAQWQLIKNAGNPFEFDYAVYCRRNNLIYQQFCTVEDIRLYHAGNPQAASIIDQSHDWCMAQLDKYIADPKTKGLIQAMLLGDEVNLDEDLRQSYSETGIVHIIAISGGNVAIFFVVISYLLWWLRHKRHLWVKYAVALPLVWFYVVMAGAAPSAIRAAVMFSLLAFGIMLQKNNNSLNQLFATAFLLLCAQPAWLFSVGFQLSFAAVLSLILFYSLIYKWLSPVNKVSKMLWATVSASLAAEILVAPLVVYYFHTFPLLFIVANVAAYLFMSLVLVLGIGIIVFSVVPIAARITGICTVWLVTVFDKIVSWLQGLNPASLHFLALPGVGLLMVYVVITGFALFLVRKQKPALFVSLGAGCLLLLILCNNEWTRLHQRRLVVYRAGKANHTELINGSSFRVLHTDAGYGKKISYITKAAHTGWQAWNRDTTSANEIFYVAGKTILLLNDNIDTGGTFPVSYLVVNYTKKPDPQKLQRIFSPQLMIIGNSFARKQQQIWLRKCREYGIPTYSVAESGAFVVN